MPITVMPFTVMPIVTWKSGLAAAAMAALLATVASGTAEASKCTRLGYSVNDYGKDGPTKDARDLLDKHIAKWAAGYGVKKYTVGKKDVSCELFLDFIVFDEYTCKAAATVCWTDGPAPPAVAPADGAIVKKKGPPPTKAKATAPAKKADDTSVPAKPVSAPPAPPAPPEVKK